MSLNSKEILRMSLNDWIHSFFVVPMLYLVNCSSRSPSNRSNTDLYILLVLTSAQYSLVVCTIWSSSQLYQAAAALFRKIQRQCCQESQYFQTIDHHLLQFFDHRLNSGHAFILIILFCAFLNRYREYKDDKKKSHHG